MNQRLETFFKQLPDISDNKIPSDYYNLLLIALMEENNITSYEAKKKEKYILPYSDKTFDKVLKCKRDLTKDEFVEFCQSLHIQINSYPKLYPVKIERLREYRNTNDRLNFQEYTKEIGEINNDDICNEIDSITFDQKIHYEFLKTKLSKLSVIQKNILMEHLTLANYIDTYHEMFLATYLDLSDVGKKVLNDYLLIFYTETVAKYSDRLCRQCECLEKSVTTVSCTPISDDEIISSIRKIDFLCNIGYFALCIPKVDSNGWKLLKMYHQINAVLGKKKVDDDGYFNSQETTVFGAMSFFIDSLSQINYCRNQEQNVSECIGWHSLFNYYEKPQKEENVEKENL